MLGEKKLGGIRASRKKILLHPSASILWQGEFQPQAEEYTWQTCDKVILLRFGCRSYAQISMSERNKSNA
jgi:hypothetical protein